MKRVYYMSVLTCLVLLTTSMIVASTSWAQTKDRRGEPNALSTGYYVVDSDDNVPSPWRPDYFFVDTNYHRTEWNQVWTGPQQYAPKGQFFFNPAYTDLSQMDTTNEAM